MKKLLLVHGHGRTAPSLGHHLVDVARAHLARAGVDLRVHDLLADGFDPVLRLAPGQGHAPALEPDEDPLVARYQADVRWADAFVVVQPVWWFGPPAILKGWVDRVLVDGVALNHDGEPPTPLLGGRSALIVQTFHAPRVVDRLLMRRLSYRFWRDAVFGSVGVHPVAPLALYEAKALTPRRLARFERKLRRALDQLN